MTWAAVSRLKVLPEQTVDEITKHVVSLGFKKEYMARFRYDFCSFDETEEKQHQDHDL